MTIDVLSSAASLIVAHTSQLQRDSHHGLVKRYLDGDHNLPYMPRGVTREYRRLARRSVTNWLPLVSDTFAKGLFVDGYRPAKASENAKAWDYWQDNGLDARQTLAHRGALEYGASYTLVLPGDDGPSIRPLHPTRTVVFYEDDDDEWPQIALVSLNRALDGRYMYRLYDETNAYTIAVKGKGEEPEVVGVDEHGVGVVPFVRFRESLGSSSLGIIAPHVRIQDRINESVFALQIALQFASFRQRWATGLVIPVDENPFLPDGVTANPKYGQPIEPFQAAVDRLWITDSPDAKFGDFDQTDVSGHLNAYAQAVQSLAAISQVPPHVLLGDLVNLSADALAAAEAATQRKIGEYETLFGESWEQVLRLAAAIDGNTEAAQDEASEVRWRDTEARSLASTVDALGKMVTMLGVPPEAAWERIPGVTDQDVARWKAIAASSDGMAMLAKVLADQSAPPSPASEPATPPPGVYPSQYGTEPQGV